MAAGRVANPLTLLVCSAPISWNLLWALMIALSLSSWSWFPIPPHTRYFSPFSPHSATISIEASVVTTLHYIQLKECWTAHLYSLQTNFHLSPFSVYFLSFFLFSYSLIPILFLLLSPSKHKRYLCNFHAFWTKQFLVVTNTLVMLNSDGNFSWIMPN